MDDPEVLVDGWQLDVAAHQITKGQVIRRLEPKAMQVLVALAAQPGAVISRSRSSPACGVVRSSATMQSRP